MRNRLRLNAQFLADMGEISLKRVAVGPDTRISGEVIAVFATVEVRDVVRRAAKELGGSSDSGIRLEIPSSMKPSLKTLEAISYNLKQKNKGMKRSIKFDDTEMDLVLDFNTDPDNGGDWKRITASQAKAMQSRIPKGAGRTVTLTDGELENMITGP